MGRETAFNNNNNKTEARFVKTNTKSLTISLGIIIVMSFHIVLHIKNIKFFMFKTF